MLSRKNLVRLKKDFSRIRKDAKNYDSPSFGLLISYQDTGEPAQAAFIVSKKVDRKSVVRHAVKRKLAEAVRGFLPRLAKNTQLVFLTKQKAVESSREELQNELETVLRRARLITA